MTTIKQKETFRKSFKLTDAKSGMKIDLTGCTAYSEMRREPGGELLGIATCTVDATKGTIDVIWTSSVTANWAVGNAGYDVWLECEGDKKPIYTETIKIIKGYTQNVGD